MARVWLRPAATASCRHPGRGYGRRPPAESGAHRPSSRRRRQHRWQDARLCRGGSSRHTVGSRPRQGGARPRRPHRSGRLRGAVSPDGATVAAVADDGALRVWDALKGKQKGAAVECASKMVHVAFAPDGRSFATASLDGCARLWDAASGNLIRVYPHDTPNVSSVAFSPDGKLLATGAGDHTVRLWDVATGWTIAALKGHTRRSSYRGVSPRWHNARLVQRRWRHPTLGRRYPSKSTGFERLPGRVVQPVMERRWPPARHLRASRGQRATRRVGRSDSRASVESRFRPTRPGRHS